MATWQIAMLVVLISTLAGVGALLLWLRRSTMTPAEVAASVRELGIDLVRLPGRLRCLAADPRTPRRARWALIALALYVVSPIDPIPDFVPGIGHLDEVLIVPLALRHIRRMVPPEVWAEHFSPRTVRAGTGERHRGQEP